MKIAIIVLVSLMLIGCQGKQAPEHVFLEIANSKQEIVFECILEKGEHYKSWEFPFALKEIRGISLSRVRDDVNAKKEADDMREKDGWILNY